MATLEAVAKMASRSVQVFHIVAVAITSFSLLGAATASSIFAIPLLIITSISGAALISKSIKLIKLSCILIVIWSSVSLWGNWTMIENNLTFAVFAIFAPACLAATALFFARAQTPRTSHDV